METYYAIALGTNTMLTFDVQVLDPVIGDNGLALVLGARLGLNF